MQIQKYSLTTSFILRDHPENRCNSANTENAQKSLLEEVTLTYLATGNGHTNVTDSSIEIKSTGPNYQNIHFFV